MHAGGCPCRVCMHKCMCRMHECVCACRVCNCVQGACPCGLEDAHVHARGVGVSVWVCLWVQGVHVHAGLARVCVNVWFARCAHVCAHPATRPGCLQQKPRLLSGCAGEGLQGGWAASLLRLCQGEEAAPVPSMTCPRQSRLPWHSSLIKCLEGKRKQSLLHFHP